MININEKVLLDVFVKYSSELTDYNNEIIMKLEAFSKDSKHSSLTRSFIKKIISWIKRKRKNFFTLTQDDIINIVEHLGEVPVMKAKFHGSKTDIFFKNCLLDKFNYKDRRSSFYPKVFNNVGIKSCVYCNSQLTVTISKVVENKQVDYSARYQLDHYYPKDKYPYLSVALFNLYPVCASCNLRKSNKDYNDFELYTNELSKSKFRFNISNFSIAEYLRTDDIEKLEISLESDSSVKRHDEFFRIKDIYDTQKDVAAEIIDKSLKYNSSYKKALNSAFGALNISNELVNSYILGNYTEPHDIHKRPMSKFMQDVGRQVGLIAEIDDLQNN